MQTKLPRCASLKPHIGHRLTENYQEMALTHLKDMQKGEREVCEDAKAGIPKVTTKILFQLSVKMQSTCFKEPMKPICWYVCSTSIHVCDEVVTKEFHQF